MIEDWSRLAPALALAVALAASTGLRAWLPMLLAGGLARVGALELGESFAFLSSNEALIVFSVATLLEIGADKIPALDHVLDGISTVVRPAAGSLLAASALGVVSDPLTALVLGVAVGAPSSLIPHAAKSALRAASTALTAGLANPILSLAEDAVTVIVFVLAVLVPVVVAVALGVVAFFLVRRLLRGTPDVVRTA
jgi:hypothetical protein